MGFTFKIFNFRKLSRKLVYAIFPKSMRHWYFRNKIRFSYELPTNLTFRVARSKEDLERAFKLLHNCYVEAGLMDPHPSGLRVTKYHALPTTTTLVALWDDKIIGTVSLIRKSVFGLPMENIFDLNSLSQIGARYLEVSALAIDPSFTGRQGQILLPFCKFIADYSHQYFGANYIAICVHPKWLEFYESILRFEPLKQRVIENYSFVKGAPAAGGLLDLDNWSKRLKKTYGNVKPEKDGHLYFKRTKFVNFQFPDRNIAKISDPVLTPELFDYFFNKKTQVLKNLDDRELIILHQLYQDNDFRSVFPPISSAKVYYLRPEPRIESLRCASIKVSENTQIQSRIFNLSTQGLSMFTERGLRVGQNYQLEVDIGSQSPVLIKATVKWREPNTNCYGLLITQSCQEWQDYVSALKNDLYQKVGS